jgi:hypothetical protein
MSTSTNKSKPRKHTAEWFIQMFDAIPDRAWKTGSLGVDGSPRCALGHCGITEYSDEQLDDPIVRSLASKLKKVYPYVLSNAHPYEVVYLVNDGARNTGGPGQGPKQRILAALRKYITLRR